MKFSRQSEYKLQLSPLLELFQKNPPKQNAYIRFQEIVSSWVIL